MLGSPCDFALVASIKNTINEHDRIGSVMLWALKEKQCIFELKGHKDVINCLCFSPDGKHLLSGDASGEIIIWDVKKQVKKTNIKINNQPIWINDIQFFDNQFFFTAHQDGVIRAWQLTANDNKLTVNLQWHTAGEVILKEASFNGIHNLDKRNLLLLKKKGGKLAKEERRQANSYLQLGRLQLQTEQFHRAIETLDQAINYDPNFTLAYIERRRAKVLSRDFKGGEYDYTFAIDTSKNEQDELAAYYHRGLLYERCGIFQNTKNDLKHARKIDLPTFSEEERNFKKYLHAQYKRVRGKNRISEVFLACQVGISRFRHFFRASDVTKKDKQGLTLLHHAIQFNQMEIVKELLGCGADPALQEDKYKHTALRFVLATGKENDFELIKLLVEANPNVINVFDHNGVNSFHCTVLLKNRPLVTYFLKMKADPDARILGKSPIALIIATQKLDSAMVQLLLENGADYTIMNYLTKGYKQKFVYSIPSCLLC